MNKEPKQADSGIVHPFFSCAGLSVMCPTCEEGDIHADVWDASGKYDADCSACGEQHTVTFEIEINAITAMKEGQ